MSNPTPKHALPSSEQRDADGRKTAVRFASQQSGSAVPAAQCWMVALDGSEHATQALAEAIRLAGESGLHTLDLVNVQPWLSKEAAETELGPRGYAVAEPALALLDAKQVKWRLHVLMGEPAPCIVEQAQMLGSRGIIVGARGLSVTETILLGSVAQKVIHTARRPVLVVRSPVAAG